MREFNTTGLCVPKKHYMVDISDKLEKITALIDKGRYFTINRGRQYGKTTTFSRLQATLRDRYVVLRMSFEGVGDKGFESDCLFVKMFVTKVLNCLKKEITDIDILDKWMNVANTLDGDTDAFICLSDGIADLCASLDKPVLLMIDEVDKTSNNQVFLNFLGMLRNKYLDAQDENDATFHSVILAGVYDIKNLKLKLHPNAERKYNSPWNIAVDFDVDMSFSAEEIATMLTDYENDTHTGMDIQRISGKIRFYTGGYPFLVSWLCKWMDEKNCRIFTEDALEFAVMEILKAKNTLFDDMMKKVHDHTAFSNMLKDILLSGQKIAFVRDNPSIDLGVNFGICSEKNGKVTVSNIIFETRLYNYFLSMNTQEQGGFSFEQNQFLTDDNHLNMPQILRKFGELIYAEYREQDEHFYERQGGLLFLCFLKPIINGTGNYYVEPQTRMNGRMDIVVFYERREYIIELKIWHGEQYREKGLAQLASYMESRKAENGYLVSFNFNQKKEQKLQELRIPSQDGKKEYLIYEVII